VAAGTFTLFKANIDDLRMQDLIGGTVKFALVSSSYTPNTGTTGHDEWADVSANEIAAGNGYTAGGATLTSDGATPLTNGHGYISADVEWTASGGSIPQWRYAVLYVSGSVWGKTNPLVGYILGDTTPTDVPATADGQTLTLTCPTNGWFTMVQA
jgi:hypothetical protein